MGPHLDRGLTDSERLGDLRKGKLLKSMHHDRHSLIFGQLLNRRMHPRLHSLVDLRFLAGPYGGIRQLAGRSELLWPAPAPEVSSRVGGNRIEPGLEASAAVKFYSRADHREKGSLGEVGGERRPDQMHQVALNGASMAVEKLLESP